MKQWQGRAGGMHEKVQMINLNDEKPPKNAFAFVGFCSDEGVRRNHGRVGAAAGPAELRKALSTIPLTVKKPIIDCGDITCEDRDLEAAQARLTETVSTLIEHGCHPIILGGGHEVSWGTFRGIPNRPCGIINFDAHFDLRDTLEEEKGSSGTPFWQIAQQEKENFQYACIGIQKTGNHKELFDRAKQLQVKIVDAESLHLEGWQAGEKLIHEIIDSVENIYLTICLDGFASPYAPGVSSPQPLGILPWHAIPLLRIIAASGKVAAFDVAELCPKFDIDNRTAKLAAALIAEYMNGTDRNI